MYRYMFPEDSHYTSEVARFVREAVYDRLRYDVVPDPRLGERILEIDTREHQIKVKPGLPFKRFHGAIDRAVLYLVGGNAWVPEFHHAPRLRIVRDFSEEV